MVHAYYLIVSINFVNIAVARKRFYRKSSILEAGSGFWEVTLDQKRVKTPAGQVLRVENETLALALSHEWDAQHELINMSSMHLVIIFIPVLYSCRV